VFHGAPAASADAPGVVATRAPALVAGELATTRSPIFVPIAVPTSGVRVDAAEDSRLGDLLCVDRGPAAAALLTTSSSSTACRPVRCQPALTCATRRPRCSAHGYWGATACRSAAASLRHARSRRCRRCRRCGRGHRRRSRSGGRRTRRSARRPAPALSRRRRRSA
jgi:hypothetical protein